MRFLRTLIRNLILPNNAGTNDPRLVLGPDIPAILVAYYAPRTVVAAEIAYSDATHYQYTVWLYDGTTATDLQATGWVSVAAVYEGVFQQLVPTSNVPRTLGFGDFTHARTDGTTYFFAGASGGNFVPFSAGYSNVRIGNFVDLTIDGISQPRGLVTQVSSTANTAAITAETVVLTTSNFDLIPGRAYQVEIEFEATPSVVNRIGTNIRLTNLAGASIMAFSNTLPALGGTTHISEHGYFIHPSGFGSVTINLVQTVVTTAGTVVENGSANTVRSLIVRDCGAAADFAGFQAV